MAISPLLQALYEQIRRLDHTLEQHLNTRPMLGDAPLAYARERREYFATGLRMHDEAMTKMITLMELLLLADRQRRSAPHARWCTYLN